MEISSCCFSFSIFFMQFLLVCMTINARTNITTDKHALLSLKSSISFDPYNTLTHNWSISNVSPCNWVGVTCSSRHNRVTALDLSYMDLVGELTPHLGNLSFLISLNLNQNSFHNSLPQELSQLRRLKTLECSVNNFSGKIPSWLGLLPNIKFLFLGNNSFSGFLPPSLFNLSKLEILHLGVNSLEGTIPRDIGNLPRLKWLNISFNHFSGNFPLGILNLSMMETLSLSSNSLSGHLPLDLGNHLPRLQTFIMVRNKFDGEIPSSLSRCSLLQTIGLSYNKFSGNIPKEYGNLTQLEWLELNNNHLTGAIPKELCVSSSLSYLFLYSNILSGAIPKEIGNLTAIELLSIEFNNFGGEIPQEIGKLYTLKWVGLGSANLSGTIPKEIFNISSLIFIELSDNNLVGTLPTSIGYALPDLETLYLGINFISGAIPESISNCSKLAILSLEGNRFSDTLPTFLGNLRLLEELHLQGNLLTNNPASQELSIINSLVNCNYIRHVLLSSNPLYAILPSSIGNLSSSLEFLAVEDCGLKGIIPNQIGNLSGLVTLNLESNNLRGFIPPVLGRVHELQRLYLGRNKFNGPIPHSLCEAKYLGELYLHNNQLSGGVPKCFGNSTSLRHIDFGSNRLSSRIPSSLCSLKDLLTLDLSSNFLDGFLPIEVEGFKELYILNISHNEISGIIPVTIGQLQSLESLSLAHNRLEGPIPKQISQIVSLEFLDLSLNRLSGSIPVSLEGLTYLKYFNVSFNELSGEIPSDGCFKNLTSASFLFNEGLCGIPKFHVPPCHSAHHSKIKTGFLIVVAALGVALIISFLIIAIILTRQPKKLDVPSVMNIHTPLDEIRISYFELARATSGFSQSNLIGSGSFGSVYKGILNNGMPIAVKVFNQSERALRSVDVECEVLKNLRHRNLTKVITCCFSDNYKVLVLEYMSNGSLDQWLHSQSNYLDIIQRLNIMIDVACALEYLHHGYTIPIVHCDLKPANVLLDEDMVAHVSDFSVTKLLTKEENVLQTETLATLGYMAPEYGSTGMVSTQCDTYSFGVVLMETFSKRRPTDEYFSEDLSLKSWMRNSIPHHILEVVDSSLFIRVEDKDFTAKLQCISSILELALQCVADSPEMRLNMKDVVARLNRIKLQFLRDCDVTSNRARRA
ncbi:putative receptor-like protein kinase At3g47110 [Ipomoea triloba]|uniref:putative receptor-like protein kinase At3g47110 n=1 Tax=Ipomoea triloba TaxID=35885 RepID=UPI00125D6E6E|nr:putative receptor-like protein kinase At3g47110 [Ipomoea triloba]